jgi:hypothetical protein
MQIINNTHFNKENYLHVPMAAVEPTGSETPNNVTELDSLCVLVEKQVLLNALGLVLYKLLFSLTNVTIELPENARFKKLIEGDEYDDKIWEGLKHDYSLIAYRVYERFTTETNIRLSAIGAAKVDPENATQETPAYLIATANQRFIKAYQGEMSDYPEIYGNFVDYYGCNDDVKKNMYQYLLDKQADFPEWKPSMFRFYGDDDKKNSFGI